MTATEIPTHARCFENAEALAQQLATDVAHQLEAAITDRGHASIAVSGGRTPLPFFAALAHTPLRWNRMTITLADERCVPTEDPASNTRLVCKHLLRGPATAARFIPLYEDNLGPTGAIVGCRTALEKVPSPLDVVILGMGDDGHTASLFPWTDFPETDDPNPCCLGTAPQAPRVRISLTPSRLLNSRQVTLHITGRDKWEVLERACEPGPSQALPVRLLLHQQRTPVNVYWSP